MSKRIAWAAPLAVLMLSAAAPAAEAGGYYGHRGYGDCADDWRYCDRYLRDDAPYYYRSEYYGGHRGYGRDYGYGYGRRHGYGHDWRRYGGYRGYGGSYGYGGRFYVCDPDGDRCYGSFEPYWNYREYYRRNGYHWIR